MFPNSIHNTIPICHLVFICIDPLFKNDDDIVNNLEIDNCKNDMGTTLKMCTWLHNVNPSYFLNYTLFNYD